VRPNELRLFAARSRGKEVHLDEAQIHAVFQQMRGVGVPERVDVRAFVDSALLAGANKGRLQARAGNRSRPRGDEVACALTDRSRKQPLRRAVGPPVRAQHHKRCRRQGHVAVAPALAVDVQHAPIAVHVGDLQVRALQQAQAADVDRRQARPVDRQPHGAEDALHLIATQDHGELRLAHGPHELEELPLAAQCALVEELDPAQRDGETRRREVLDVGEVEEILAEVLFPKLIGRPVEVNGELLDGTGVGFLRARGEPAELLPALAGYSRPS